MRQDGEEEGLSWCDVWEHGEGCVAYETACDTGERVPVNRKFKVRCDVDEDAIRERVHGPDVGCPVGVAEAAAEREEPAQNLWNLAPVGERPESGKEDDDYASAEFDAVQILNAED